MKLLTMRRRRLKEVSIIRLIGGVQCCAYFIKFVLTAIITKMTYSKYTQKGSRGFNELS